MSQIKILVIFLMSFAAAPFFAYARPFTPVEYQYFNDVMPWLAGLLAVMAFMKLIRSPRKVHA